MGIDPNTRKTIIIIGKEDLKNYDMFTLLGHEAGHFVDYDNGEGSASNVENQITNKPSTGTVSEEKKNDILESAIAEKEEREKNGAGYSGGELVAIEEFGNPNDGASVLEKSSSYWSRLSEKTLSSTKATDVNVLDTEQAQLKKEIALLPQGSEEEKQLKNKIFYDAPDSDNIFHNLKLVDGVLVYDPSIGNKKKINANGEEFVYNEKTGKLVTDPINRGTYNSYGKLSNEKGKQAEKDYNNHLKDIVLWIEFGTGSDDKTTKAQRSLIAAKAYGQRKLDEAKALGKQMLDLLINKLKR